MRVSRICACYRPSVSSARNKFHIISVDELKGDRVNCNCNHHCPMQSNSNGRYKYCFSSSQKLLQSSRNQTAEAKTMFPMWGSSTVLVETTGSRVSINRRSQPLSPARINNVDVVLLRSPRALIRNGHLRGSDCAFPNASRSSDKMQGQPPRHSGTAPHVSNRRRHMGV
jgi:hypothetical protein